MLLELRKLDHSDIEKVRAWRMLPEVSKYMYSDPDINKEDQEKWYHDISLDSTKKHWIIVYDEVDIGLLSITDIDIKNKKCNWAYYIADTSFRGKGIAGTIECNVYDNVFYSLEMNKLCCEVFSFNQKVIDIHKKFGSEIEGERKEHIIKNNVKYDIVEMAILKEKWGKIRNDYNYEKISFED